jgi:hypothetical protein
VTAQPEQEWQFRVWMRSGASYLVEATGQGKAMDEAERRAVARGCVGRDAQASKAQKLR